MLSRLVAAFGPVNWKAISEMIPGRTGKACQFRWCNYLDPRIKHEPFSEEEDQIIMTAHHNHGNKWKSISRMLPGRTGYAIKNHWNVNLKNKQAELGSHEFCASDLTAAQILGEMKTSTQKALSFGDVVTSRNQEEEGSGNFHGCQNYEDQAFQAKGGFLAAKTTDNPPVLRPKASYGAFSVCYPPSGGPKNCSGALTVMPLQGPLAQALGSEFGIHHFIKDVHGEPLIPHQCGHGCCSSQNEPNCESSLLGPEFVDYIEPSSFLSQELMSIAADLSQIPWSRSGTSYTGPRMPSMEMLQPPCLSERGSAAFAAEALGQENKNDPSGKLKGVKK